MRKICCLLLFGLFVFSNAQEFNSRVTINAEQTGQPNLPIFRTLQSSLEEFINNNKWTDIEYLPQERIECNFFINIASYSGNIFESTIQVQASRPVYNSGYQTTIANFNDSDFAFEYLEYQPLVYNENSDQGNLVAVITYYLFTILGIDADTFKENGGTDYFEKAKQIVNVAQAGGGKGWSAASKTTSRYHWNNDILSGLFKEYREMIYSYHFKGLDQMADNTKSAKKEIIQSLDQLKVVNKKRQNSYVMRSFFDAKSIEISRLLTGGPKVDIAKTVDMLKNIAPSYRTDWDTIKN